MEEGYLIDSYCVIDFCNGKLPKTARDFLFDIEQPLISVITQIEVMGFLVPDKKEEQLLNDFVSFARILPLSIPVSLKTIDIRKKKRIKLPDAIIAATAIHHGLILVTRNVEDFKGIVKIQLLDPWEM